MTTLTEIIARMNESDVRVFLDGDGLMVIAPTGAMGAERVAFMKQHRDMIIAHLRVVEANRPCVLRLRATPDLDEPDSTDPEDGRRIVAEIRAADGDVQLDGDGIVLTWMRALNDTAPAFATAICAARTAVMLALHKEDDDNAEYSQLERAAI